MPSCFIDYEMQENVFSTTELKRIFDERARIQRWLDVEASLALAQGDAGIIPADAARGISNKAKLECLNMQTIKNEYKVNKNTLMPIIKTLREACGCKHGEFVHYGVTTQDIIDTGQMLEVKQVLSILYRDLRNIELFLIDIACKYIDTPMIGRSHGQYAIPITFGLKVSVWLAEVRRHIERLKSLKQRVLFGQLSGAVGTMAALGDKAYEIAAKTLSRLGLNFNHISWHTSRDNIAEVCACFSMITSTAAKIANEIYQLSKTDILELRGSKKSKKGMSSSTMPHKNNPVLCERIIVLSKHARALLGVVMETMVHEHERDPRSLWAEWLAFPQLAIYTGTALNYLINVFGEIEVIPSNMKNNLYKYRELIVSEYLLFKLGKHIGKMSAQEKLYQLIQLSEDKGKSLKEVLLNDQSICGYLDEDDLGVIEHPELYIGNAKNITMLVVNDSKKARAEELENI